MADKRNVFVIQEEQFSKLCRRFEKLKRHYDQFFLGLEKREPGFEREQLERDLLRTPLNRTASTALRFRFQNLVSSYRVQAARWDRITSGGLDGLRGAGNGFQRQRQRAVGPTLSAEDIERIETTAGEARALLKELGHDSDDKS